MNKLLGKSFSLILCIGVLLTQSAMAAQDLSQAKQLCENASAQQREMARAAGYDIDALCASLKSQTASSNQQQPSVNPILPRELGQFPLDDGSQDKEASDKEKEDTPRVEQELEKFGYDLFAGLPTTYTPVSDIPVPSNYVVGPGDVIQVQLYGKENNSYELTVSRSGDIQFPQLGPINVAGLSYTELKESLTQQINEQFIGVKSNISLGELRSIQVFVLGESYKPGAYTVSSLSTVMNALYVSGGVKEVGSLRNIQLKRNGQLISSIDLYDFLLRGDTRADRRLQSGDVIFIPSVKKTASVAGDVVRPAIYEIKHEKTISELVELAGGLLPTAYAQDVRVERIDDKNRKTVVDINLLTTAGRSVAIKSGDHLKVYPVAERNENIVGLLGHVLRPGLVAWKEGMRVTDVIPGTEYLKQNANIDAAIIIREISSLGELQPLKISLREVLENPSSEQNIKLHPRDRLVVLANTVDADELNVEIDEYLSKEEKKKKDLKEQELLDLKSKLTLELRNNVLTSINQELENQASFESPAKVVAIDGSVKFPGQYPLSKGLTVVDLVQLAGGFSESAYTLEAEITRQDLSNPQQADITHMAIDLQQEFLGTVKFGLKPHDRLTIKATPEYRDIARVEVQGEVKFPGQYTIRRGETLSQLLKRVGGFSEFAHIKATVFSRKELREREEEQIKTLQDRLRQEIATTELEQSNIGKSADVNKAKSLLDVLDTTEATGRLVVDLNAVLEGTVTDVVLQDGDRLIIPAFRQEVTVVGEVQVPTSHLYNQNLDFEDYIDRSGGEKDTSNSDAIYIVKADGSVVLPNKSAWLTHNEAQVEPGDTIVVPLDTDRVNSLDLWTKVSQIVYQLALGAAAVNSF